MSSTTGALVYVPEHLKTEETCLAAVKQTGYVNTIADGLDDLDCRCSRRELEENEGCGGDCLSIPDFLKGVDFQRLEETDSAISAVKSGSISWAFAVEHCLTWFPDALLDIYKRANESSTALLTASGAKSDQEFQTILMPYQKEMKTFLEETGFSLFFHHGTFLDEQYLGFHGTFYASTFNWPSIGQEVFIPSSMDDEVSKYTVQKCGLLTLAMVNQNQDKIQEGQEFEWSQDLELDQFE